MRGPGKHEFPLTLALSRRTSKRNTMRSCHVGTYEFWGRGDECNSTSRNGTLNNRPCLTMPSTVNEWARPSSSRESEQNQEPIERVSGRFV